MKKLLFTVFTMLFGLTGFAQTEFLELENNTGTDAFFAVYGTHQACGVPMLFHMKGFVPAFSSISLRPVNDPAFSWSISPTPGQNIEWSHAVAFEACAYPLLTGFGTVTNICSLPTPFVLNQPFTPGMCGGINVVQIETNAAGTELSVTLN